MSTLIGTTLRKPLETFAVAMEKAMRKNEHKGGWYSVSIGWLAGRLIDEVYELIEEVHSDQVLRFLLFSVKERVSTTTWSTLTPAKSAKVRKELVDIANFCMMIHDRLLAKEKAR